MSLTLRTLLLVTLTGIVLAFPFDLQNSSTECTTDLECLSNHCCLLEPIRYAIPSCKPFQQKGESCRVNADTITTNLTYLNNLQLEIRNVNYILCPCANGLFCERGICN